MRRLAWGVFGVCAGGLLGCPRLAIPDADIQPIAEMLREVVLYALRETVRLLITALLS